MARLDTARARLLVVLLLLVGQVALFPAFAVQPVDEAAGVFPDETDFVADPQPYLGERVVTGGIVQATDPVVIRVETTSGSHRVTITDTAITPARGDNSVLAGARRG